MIAISDRADRPSDIPLAFVELPSPSSRTSVHFSNELFATTDVITRGIAVSGWWSSSFSPAGVANPNSDLNSWSSPSDLAGYAESGIVSGSILGDVGVALSGGSSTGIVYGSFWTTGALSVSGASHARVYAQYGFTGNPHPRWAIRSISVYLTCHGSGGVLGVLDWHIQRGDDYMPTPLGRYENTTPVFSLPDGTTGVALRVQLAGAPAEGLVLRKLQLEVGTTQSTTGSATAQLHRKIQKPITVRMVVEDSAGGWYPVISDGIVYRTFELTSQEPSGSWLRQHFQDNDQLVLVYTVPEMYARWQQGGQPVLRLREYAQPLDQYSVKLQAQNVRAIWMLRVGDRVLVSESSPLYPDDPVPAGISHVAWDRGEIVLERALGDTDDVEVQYDCAEPGYVYCGGARDRLDLNPSPGHVISIPQGTGTVYLPASGLVTSGVALYLIPVAAYPASGFPDPATMKRARGITRFLYHRIYSLGESERLPFLRARATYGFARFNVDAYSDATVVSQPFMPLVSLPDYPSALVISNLFVDPGVKFRQASVWDVRRRGGGLDENIADDDPRLSGLGQHLWDIGGWNAERRAEGGTLRIVLPASLLSEYTREEIERIVRKYVAAGVIPSIQFE